MYLSREKHLSHINDPEKITFLRRMMDLIEISIRSGTVQFSDFLDPYERHLVQSIVSSIDDIDCIEVAKEIEMERKILSFGYNLEERKVCSEIVFLEIQSKFENLEHRKVLGSIIGLGIDRSKIGDISILNKKAQIVVKKEIADFLLNFLKKIGRNGVQVEKIALEDYTPKVENWDYSSITISSMRLDTLISEILRISRTKSKKIIEKEYVKVDFKTIKIAHFEVQDSLLSIRGYGRFKICNDISTTKKGRYRVTYGKLRKED